MGAQKQTEGEQQSLLQSNHELKPDENTAPTEEQMQEMEEEQMQQQQAEAEKKKKQAEAAKTQKQAEAAKKKKEAQKQTEGGQQSLLQSNHELKPDENTAPTEEQMQ